MKVKGFTLVELLAIIVILAIIALITTPIVMDAIKSAKKGAVEEATNNYIKAVELTIQESRINGLKLSDGEYPITIDGNICSDKALECTDNKIMIQANGEKPNYGRIVLKNKSVVIERVILKLDNYFVGYDIENNKFQAQELYEGTLCTKASGVDLNNLVAGNEFTCNFIDNNKENNLTFYVLGTSGDNISLIMNANVNENGKAVTPPITRKFTVMWCGDETLCKTNNNWDNTKGPLTAEEKLKEYTSSWKKLAFSQVTIPSVTQIRSAYTGSMPSWLKTNIGISNLIGYWTSIPDESSLSCARSVGYGGDIPCFNINESAYSGLRPVITISKSNLS